VAKAGIARTFQNIRLFGEMTALENVMVGCHVRSHQGVFGAVFRHKAARLEEAGIRERSMALLEFVGIGQFANRTSRFLSYGDQRRLEIGARWPPSRNCCVGRAGRRHERDRKSGAARAAGEDQKRSKTVLLIEHDVKLMMGLCDRITVLEYGKPIAEGLPADIQRIRL